MGFNAAYNKRLCIRGYLVQERRASTTAESHFFNRFLVLKPCSEWLNRGSKAFAVLFGEHDVYVKKGGGLYHPAAFSDDLVTGCDSRYEFFLYINNTKR
jgi:hypothetical protein